MEIYKSLDIKYAEEHVCCLNKLSILCEFTYGSNIQIKYDVKTCNNEKPDCKGQVEAVIDYLLKVVFKNRDSIVSEYLDNLFLSILLSNAESIEAIFFVYLLKCKRKELPDFNIQKIVSDETLENKDSKNKYTYKQKKMLLMIMENIGDLVLHQEVDKKSYIMSDIFNNYSSHIVPETMLKIILTIKELCLYFGFTEDIIYNNVSVFEEE